MGNQDTKQEDSMRPADCRMNFTDKGFQRWKQLEIQRGDEKEKKVNAGSGKGIKHISRRKFKEKNIQIKKNNLNASIDSRNFDIKMLKAYKLFKSLHILESFQSKYSKQYPVMILSKNESIRKLRQEISKEKQNHEYFSSEEQLSSFVKPTQNPNISQEQVNIMQNKKQSKKPNLLNNQSIHRHFTVIQRVEWLFIRICQTGRHQNVLTIIKQMDNEYSLNEQKAKLQEIYSFVKYIDTLNIELMDMLFYQLHQSEGQMFQHRNEIILDQKQQFNGLKIIDVKEAIIRDRSHKEDIQKIVSYETYKEKGWQIYKSNKVCFYILAIESQTFIPQLQPLNIPQNLIILEILLEKYDAFAQMIQVNELSICILIDGKRKFKFHQLLQNNHKKWKRLNIRILLSKQLPKLDIEGNFMLNFEIQGIYAVQMASIGSGDLWNCLGDDLNQLQKFEYVQVIGVRNCLQSGFDCFLLGKSNEEGFEWATKMFEPIERLTELRFMSQDKQIKSRNFSFPQEQIFSQYLFSCMIHPCETDYVSQLNSIIQSSLPFYVFGNHSLLSTKFIKRVIDDIEKKKQRKYRKKIINEENEKFVVFEREFIDDALRMSSNKKGQSLKKWGLFVCEREGSYYPLHRKENDGVFDIQGCSRTLSLSYLSQLNLSVNRFLALTGSNNVECYIDPHISFQSERIEEISLEIERRINSLLAEENKDHNQGIESIYEGQSQSSQTASRVISSISKILILQQQNQNLEQQITIVIN